MAPLLSLQANLKTTLHPKALASRILQARQPLPRLLTRAFHPLSAHNALAIISISLPNLCLLDPKCGLGDGLVGNATAVSSVQSITRTLGILLSVVCVLDCAGSVAGPAVVEDCGGERRESNVYSRGDVRRLRIDIVA